MSKTAFATALAILLAISMVLAAWQLTTILLLAFAGLLLAVLLRHSAQALAHFASISVGAAMIIVIIGFALVATTFIVLAGPRIASELTQVAESLPSAFQEFKSYVAGTTLGGYLLNNLSNGVRKGWSIVGMFGDTVSTALDIAVNSIIVVTVAIFLAVNPGLYRRGFLHLVPKDRRERSQEVLDALEHGLWRWLIGQSIDMFAVALMTGLGLWLIGVPVPVALGLIAGLTNFIPYLGPFLSGIPATLIAFSQSPTNALYTAGLFLLVQHIEGYILMPMVQKRATSLPPVLTILAVVALGGLFGILGAFLATPLLVAVIIVVRMLYVEDVLDDHLND